MKKRYEWRELTKGGLLRDPKECGPSYDRSNINARNFRTEDEAFKAFDLFKKKYGTQGELVLVVFYDCDDDS